VNLADYTPGEIPADTASAPPSVWAPGDVHHTHEQVIKESPAGIAGITGDPRDAEIERLRAELAARDTAAETQAAAEEVAATA